MKILIVGMGMTHYYNQTLNRLNLETGIEIVNVVDANGKGHVSKTVFQTYEGVNFKVVALNGVIRKKFSDYSYWSFSGLPSLLKELRPDIIIASDLYLNAFVYEKKLQNILKGLNIKLIQRSIPFMLDRYEKAKKDILSGAADSTYTPFFAPFVKNIFNKLRPGKLFTLVEYLVHFLKLDKWYKRVVGRSVLLKKLEMRKYALNAVDAHVNYAEIAYSLFDSYGVPKNKIFVTYNSPDTDILFEIRRQIERESPILPPNPHRIIHLSRLTKTKKVDLLIKSLKILKSEFTDAELLVVGSGPEEESLKGLARQLNLEDSVKFIGRVYKPEELGKYLKSSAIYVLAGMGGLSINDAMIFGLPVICSVCDGTEKHLVYDNHNGLYFKEGDAEDLAKKITYLFRNPDLTAKMGKNSTEIIKNKINMNVVIERYLQAFDYVLNK